MRAPYAGITFLTYEDLEAGDHFYRVVLGLPLIEDQEWAKVYRLHGSAHVGIVEARSGSVEVPVGSGTLISIVVEDAGANPGCPALDSQPGKVQRNSTNDIKNPVYSQSIDDRVARAASSDSQVICNIEVSGQGGILADSRNTQGKGSRHHDGIEHNIVTTAATGASVNHRVRIGGADRFAQRAVAIGVQFIVGGVDDDYRPRE